MPSATKNEHEKSAHGNSSIVSSFTNSLISGLVAIRIVRVQQLQMFQRASRMVGMFWARVPVGTSLTRDRLPLQAWRRFGEQRDLSVIDVPISGTSSSSQVTYQSPVSSNRCISVIRTFPIPNLLLLTSISDYLPIVAVNKAAVSFCLCVQGRRV